MGIHIKRDTAANWTSNNPILEEGQPAYETDTLKIKFGNGTDNWNDLDYANAGGGGGASTSGTIWGDITGTLSDQTDLQDALDDKQDVIGYVPEDVVNKSTNILLGTSDTLYPSQKAVKTYVDNEIYEASTSGALSFENGLTETGNVVKLGGILTQETMLEWSGAGGEGYLNIDPTANSGVGAFDMYIEESTNGGYSELYFDKDFIILDTYDGATSSEARIRLQKEGNILLSSTLGTEIRSQNFPIDAGFQGAYYDQNYEAYFTDRSLVDKEFVVNAVYQAGTSGSSNIYNVDGVLTSNRILDGDGLELSFTNVEYFYVESTATGVVEMYGGNGNGIVMNDTEIYINANASTLNLTAGTFELNGTASSSPSTEFFRADGTWAVPAGGGSGGDAGTSGFAHEAALAYETKYDYLDINFTVVSNTYTHRTPVAYTLHSISKEPGVASYTTIAGVPVSNGQSIPQYTNVLTGLYSTSGTGVVSLKFIK